MGRKTKNIFLYIMLAIFVGFIVYLIARQTGLFQQDVNNLSPTQITITDTITTNTTKIYNLDEKISINGKELIVYSFNNYENDKLVNILKQVDKWQDGYKLIAIDVEIKNIGNAKIDSLGWFTIKDNDNREYNLTDVSLYEKEPRLDIFKTLQPQEGLRGYITFAIPKDKEPYIINYDDYTSSIKINTSK